VGMHHRFAPVDVESRKNKQCFRNQVRSLGDRSCRQLGLPGPFTGSRPLQARTPETSVLMTGADSITWTPSSCRRPAPWNHEMFRQPDPEILGEFGL
jgi:hypothetical protein